LHEARFAWAEEVFLQAEGKGPAKHGAVAGIMSGLELCMVHKLVIPTAVKAEVRRVKFQEYPRQKVSATHLSK
jgi:hypothetical protein